VELVRSGQISDISRGGIVRMLVIEPSAFSDKDIELWISMDALTRAFQ
jgi:hypothetical protein